MTAETCADKTGIVWGAEKYLIVHRTETCNVGMAVYKSYSICYKLRLTHKASLYGKRV